MENKQFLESDWKKFRELVPYWQKRYIEKLNKEYIEILSQDRNPAESFWELEQRIKIDKKHPGVLIEMSRSKMIDNLFILLKDHVIEYQELHDFSDELKDTIDTYIKIFNIKL